MLLGLPIFRSSEYGCECDKASRLHHPHDQHRAVCAQLVRRDARRAPTPRPLVGDVRRGSHLAPRRSPRDSPGTREGVQRRGEAPPPGRAQGSGVGAVLGPDWHVRPPRRHDHPGATAVRRPDLERGRRCSDWWILPPVRGARTWHGDGDAAVRP